MNPQLVKKNLCSTMMIQMMKIEDDYDFLLEEDEHDLTGFEVASVKDGDHAIIKFATKTTIG